MLVFSNICGVLWSSEAWTEAAGLEAGKRKDDPLSRLGLHKREAVRRGMGQG